MCGIAGIATLTAPRGAGVLVARARAMAACLEHRGPDDGGAWESAAGTVALAHRRLSIVDLSPLGHNPMPWDDGRLWITFNGEIYNFLELRLELEAAGHRFRSRTDTEVILAAYDEWGLECIGRLAGMFAFALWDNHRERLWIARDRVGKKPLYYSEHGGQLQFASELKSIIADPAVPNDLDRESLRLYLRYGYVPAPRTIYRHVRKLPPGHQIVCESGSVRVSRYWDPLAFATGVTAATDQDLSRELEARLVTAVRQRMIADVPLGAFLSGGIDSSLVVALMQEQSTRPVQTFTVRFPDPEYDEADHAAAVARHLATDHHEQACDESAMLDVVHRLPAMFDEPFADSSAVPTYLVSKAAREHVTVALSGDGGDELFFGYPRYVHHLRSKWLLDRPRLVRRGLASIARRLPTRRLRRIGEVLANDDGDTYARFVTWWTAREIEASTGEVAETAQLYADMLRRATGVGFADLPPLLDIVSYLPEDILTKVDRASMAVSLEVRAPLLDHRVVELALALPLALKWRGGLTKLPLRRMLYERVPRQLVERPKMGFGVPLERWLRGPLQADMDRYCAGRSLEGLGLNPAPARQLWADFRAGRSRRADKVWQLFSLLAWADRRPR
ncbi:MAG TPA: asparagine synthase (glutamine-hydrolyzing) [Vicinamibacterales bacterium]|nr:asparagine synthase (glutamine-hydrolyzing) [Vicinamibacterales bacterium]